MALGRKQLTVHFKFYVIFFLIFEHYLKNLDNHVHYSLYC